MALFDWELAGGDHTPLRPSGTMSSRNFTRPMVGFWGRFPKQLPSLGALHRLRNRVTVTMPSGDPAAASTPDSYKLSN